LINKSDDDVISGFDDNCSIDSDRNCSNATIIISDKKKIIRNRWCNDI